MSTSPSDDNGVDVEAVWAQIIARWDEEAPPREPAAGPDERPEDPPADPGRSAEVDLRTERPMRWGVEDRSPGPAPYDYERDHGPPGPVGPGPRDVEPDAPSFLDGIDPGEEEFYEPPPPPPLPRPSLITGLAWLAAVGGPLFLVLCAMFWRSAPSLVVAGAVAAFAAGFVTLVLRMSDNDTDDGAVV